jgi:hypothetical protein
MSRYVTPGVALLVLCCGLVAPADADKVFATVWLETYVPAEPATDAEQAWEKSAKKSKCYVCHVKGQSKKYSNAYGDVLSQWLKSENYEKERVEAESRLVRTEIATAFERAESAADACGTPFGELFKAHRLPSPELGALSAEKANSATDEDNAGEGEEGDD